MVYFSKLIFTGIVFALLVHIVFFPHMVMVISYICQGDVADGAVAFSWITVQ